MRNPIIIISLITSAVLIIIFSGCADRELPSGDIYPVQLSFPDDGDTINNSRIYLDWEIYPDANGYRVLLWKEDSLIWDHIEFNSSVKTLFPVTDGEYRFCVGVRIGDGDFEHWSDTVTFYVRQTPFRIIGWASTPGIARDVAPLGEVIYVADGQAGMTLITRDGDSLSTGTNIDWADQYEARGIFADSAANLLIIADYRGVPPIYFFDISDRLNPTSGISGVWARLCGDVTGFWMRDTFFVAAADRDDGCYIYDYTGEPYVNHRGAPFTPDGFCLGVAARDTLVAVCAADAGIVILDVSDPEDKVQLGRCDTPGEATRALFYRNYLYVADGLAGLGVIDASDPTNPRYIYQSDFQVGDAQDLAIATVDGTDYLALATGSEGVIFYTLSNPSAPQPVGQLETMYAYGVGSDGNSFYIADRDWGIVLVSHR